MYVNSKIHVPSRFYQPSVYTNLVIIIVFSHLMFCVFYPKQTSHRTIMYLSFFRFLKCMHWWSFAVIKSASVELGKKTTSPAFFYIQQQLTLTSDSHSKEMWPRISSLGSSLYRSYCLSSAMPEDWQREVLRLGWSRNPVVTTVFSQWLSPLFCVCVLFLPLFFLIWNRLVPL